MNVWNIKLIHRRWAVLFGCLLFVCFSSASFGKHLFSGRADGLDILTGLIFLMINFVGAFSWLLCMIGYFGWPGKTSSDVLPGSIVKTRTAVIMPIYNEDVSRVGNGLRRIVASCSEAGLGAHLDYYILSDSSDECVCRDEDAEYEALVDDLTADGSDVARIYLIRRANRVDYKAGNIVNFLEKHGGAYDFVLVLDADSIMEGKVIRRMILRMQETPRIGILQSLILPIRSMTLFTRIMQYSIWRSTPLFVCGLYWFMGRDSVYWGHNALLRVEPFMAHAHLPILPGKHPIGGRIMSQDIVEAALLSRAGWSVEWELNADGSYDEIPANVLTYGQRDQRWCQGNFQHLWLVFGAGIRLVQRIYFVFGVMSYAGSLITLTMMLAGFAQMARNGYVAFGPIILWAFLLNLPVLQLLPKFLGFIKFFDPKCGIAKQTISGILDFWASWIFSGLFLYLHSCFVVGIICGKSVKWKGQSRDPKQRISWPLSCKVFWGPTLIAAIWIPLAWLLAPTFLVYAGPILFTWLFSIPIAVVTSDSRFTKVLSSRGLFPCPRAEEFADLMGGSSKIATATQGNHSPALSQVVNLRQQDPTKA